MNVKKLHSNLPLLFLLIIILITVGFRARLINVPLERDEGEYAYIGQLILQGIPPYSEAYNMKFPGIYFLYAGMIGLLGQTHTAIHGCLLIVSVISILLLYLFVRSAFDEWAAVAAAAAFALLSMSYHVQGFWANAEHFIVPLVIGANILLLSGLRNKKSRDLIFSGLLFGCAALVKQHGAFFGVAGLAALILSMWWDRTLDRRSRWISLVEFCGGALFPLLLCFFYLAFAGVLGKFYLWTFVYAKQYSSNVEYQDIKYNFIGGFQSLFSFASLIWIMSGVGSIPLISRGYRSDARLLTIGLLLGGITAVSIGFYFRPHYFLLILPAVAILFGLGIRYLYRVFSSSPVPFIRLFPPTAVVTIALLGTLAAHWDVLVQFSLPKVTETVYPISPFPFSLRIAQYIDEHTMPTDRIAIMGNEPQLLFYSQRKSATSFIYMFSLTENQPLAGQFRAEMSKQIETSLPAMLVYTNIQPDENQKKPPNWEALDVWFFHVAEVHYTLTARFEYQNINDTLFVSDPGQLQKRPTHMFWISIYEKKR
jgi:4-amino-4-deoxy-L-arabinose transferase-like glycosyltransferase